MTSPAEIGAIENTLFDEIARSDAFRARYAVPPNDAIVLATRGKRTLYLENQWGPAIPYGPVLHEDGTRNHGYRRIKGDLNAIDALAEVQGYPELAEFLRSINAKNSAIESVGCERSSQEDEREQQKFWTMSCYVDVILSELSANEEPQNLLRLATRFAAAMEGCEAWWASLELGLQRLRSMADGVAPWGLLIRVSANGRTEEEARHLWAHSLKQLQHGLALG